MPDRPLVVGLDRQLAIGAWRERAQRAMRRLLVADLLYGRNAVHEALRAGHRRLHRLLIAESTRGLETLVAEARSRGVSIEYVDRHHLDQLVAAHHQGVIAAADAFAYSQVHDLIASEGALLLALDSLQDPQNFGTLLRTAAAVGVSGVILPEHRAVGVTPAVANASAGAVEHLKVARVTNLARALRELKEHNIWVFGLAVDAQQAYSTADLRGPLALVVGSEGSGLGRVVAETCDVLLRIPTRPGAVQSLNAAVAGSLVLYEAFRQRTQM